MQTSTCLKPNMETSSAFSSNFALFEAKNGWTHRQLHKSDSGTKEEDAMLPSLSEKFLLHVIHQVFLADS